MKSWRVAKEYSVFMCFGALTRRVAMVAGGFLEREQRKSDERKPAMKAVRMTLSSFSSICEASVVKRVTKLRNDSPSVC